MDEERLDSMFKAYKAIEETEKPDFSFENIAKSFDLWPVAGVDEVGRGPLAGPVVAAAVILNPKEIPNGLNDSKRLSRKKRTIIFAEILATAQSVSLASVCAQTIDRINIRQATLEAMRRAVYALSRKPLFVLVDGRDCPAGLGCPAYPIIKGDARSQSIAAASIVAKVVRDSMMASYEEWNERYGFKTNVGYPTRYHCAAIQTYGPIPGLHRMSFSFS